MKNFEKYLLLVLALLSMGGGSSYGNTFPEVRENLPLSSEDLRAASLHNWVYRENSFQEIYDLSENYFFKSTSVVPAKFRFPGSLTTGAVYSTLTRDIRRHIFQQIFPKHFFL